MSHQQKPAVQSLPVDDGCHVLEAGLEARLTAGLEAFEPGFALQRQQPEGQERSALRAPQDL